MGVRKKKTSIDFDPEKRREFLTGFRKRKNERKQKAREKLAQQVKEEKKKARKAARSKALNPFMCPPENLSKNKKSSYQIVPEIEHLLPDSVKDFGTHTVSVTNIDSFSNLTESLQNSTNDDKSENVTSKLSKSQQKAVERETVKCLQKSRAFKMSTQLKRKKDSRQSRFQNKSKLKKVAKTKRNKHHNPKKSVS